MSLSELLGIPEPEVVEEVPPPKVTKLSPFDFVNSISYDKTDLFEMVPEAEKQYNPFMVNRAMSYSQDMVLYANEMNRFPNVPKEAQFKFLQGVVRKRKRYDKWIKADAEDEGVALLKEYFGYSTLKARIDLPLLMPDQLDFIREKLSKGGLASKKKAKK